MLKADVLDELIDAYRRRLAVFELACESTDVNRKDFERLKLVSSLRDLKSFLVCVQQDRLVDEVENFVREKEETNE